MTGSLRYSIERNNLGAYLEYETALNPQGMIVDSYSAITQVSEAAGYVAGQSWFSNLNTSGNPSYMVGIGSVDSTGTDIGVTMYNGASPSSSTITTTSSAYKVFSLWMIGSNAGWGGSANYANSQTTSSTISTSTFYLTLSANSDGLTAKFSTYWLRTRAYPPSGVMPSVTFGSVISTFSLTLYLNGVSNANTTITYGTQSNFTAVISPSTEYVSLYVNGTKVASLTQGKAVYLKTLAAGL